MFVHFGFPRHWLYTMLLTMYLRRGLRTSNASWQATVNLQRLDWSRWQLRKTEPETVSHVQLGMRLSLYSDKMATSLVTFPTCSRASVVRGICFFV